MDERPDAYLNQRSLNAKKEGNRLCNPRIFVNEYTSLYINGSEEEPGLGTN